MDKRNISMVKAMLPTKGLFDGFQSDFLAQESRHLLVTNRERHCRLTNRFLAG